MENKKENEIIENENLGDFPQAEELGLPIEEELGKAPNYPVLTDRFKEAFCKNVFDNGFEFFCDLEINENTNCFELQNAIKYCSRLSVKKLIDNKIVARFYLSKDFESLQEFFTKLY